jgi:hypothetical protein
MCKFCEGSDRKNSGKFAIYMTKWSDERGTTLSVDFDGFDEGGDTDFEVNFCPMCGKQLKQVQESTELTEALETLKDNGYICESNKHFELWQYKLSVKKELNKWLKNKTWFKSFDYMRSYIKWEIMVDIVTETMKDYFEQGKSVNDCVEQIIGLAEEAIKIGG